MLRHVYRWIKGLFRRTKPYGHLRFYTAEHISYLMDIYGKGFDVITEKREQMNKVAGIITLDVGDYTVFVEYDGHWENSGIGKYEFWGTTGYDRGEDYVVIDRLVPVFTDETPAERLEIKLQLREKYDDYVDEIKETYRDE